MHRPVPLQPSVCRLTRACQGELNGVVEDCSLALELQPKYVKALMRRSQAYERQDKLEEALADVNAVLEVDGTIVLARRKAQELERRVKEKQEKMKEEMMGAWQARGWGDVREGGS